MPSSEDKLADTISSQSESSSPTSTFENCKVDHVITNGADDGYDAVFIIKGSDVIPANYLTTAPPAGATVRVEFCDGSPLIHGRVLGNPAL